MNLTSEMIDYLDNLLFSFRWRGGAVSGIPSVQLALTGFASRCCRSPVVATKRGDQVRCLKCNDVCEVVSFKVAKRDGGSGGWTPATASKSDSREPDHEWNLIKLRETQSRRTDREDASSAHHADQGNSLPRLFARPRGKVEVGGRLHTWSDGLWRLDLTLWEARARARSYDEAVHVARCALGETWEPESIRKRVTVARKVILRRMERPWRYPSVPAPPSVAA